MFEKYASKLKLINKTRILVEDTNFYILRYDDEFFVSFPMMLCGNIYVYRTFDEIEDVILLSETGLYSKNGIVFHKTNEQRLNRLYLKDNDKVDCYRDENFIYASMETGNGFTNFMVRSLDNIGLEKSFNIRTDKRIRCALSANNDIYITREL